MGTFLMYLAGFSILAYALLMLLGAVLGDAVWFIAALLAVLTKGSNAIQTSFKIPASAADVLSAIILFFMLGCEFFINYKVSIRKSGGKEA